MKAPVPTLAQLRRALRVARPDETFGRALRSPSLRPTALRGALRALGRGDLGWVPAVKYLLFHRRLRVRDTRPVVLRALARSPDAVSVLFPLLAMVGGAPEAIRALFERLPPSRDAEKETRRLAVAAAVVRTTPGHLAAAELLLHHLRHRDLLIRSGAACSLTLWDGRGRGAGADLLRGYLDAMLEAPDPETFFVIEHLLYTRSPKGFLRGCEALLPFAATARNPGWTGWFAADRLARYGDRRDRALALAWVALHPRRFERDPDLRRRWHERIAALPRGRFPLPRDLKALP